MNIIDELSWRGAVNQMTDEEKQNKPKLTKALLKRIFGYLSPYKLQFITVFAALAVSPSILNPVSTAIRTILRTRSPSDENVCDGS